MSASLISKAPLVGRGAELRELDDALDRVIYKNAPESVSIVGGTGIGKSRLLQEFLTRTQENKPHIRTFFVQCGMSSSEAIARPLRARFGIADSATPAEVEERLRAEIQKTLRDARGDEFLHFLGAYLGLRFPESPFLRAVEDDSAQFASLARTVLRRFLELDASASPIILVFEDAQAATEDALNLIAYLTETLASAPVLVVIAGRTELIGRRPEFFERQRTQRRIVELTPLSADEAGSLLLHLLAPCGDPPNELIDAAVDMAGGSPFLLEQMVRVYLESGVLTEMDGGQWAVDLSKLDDAELPLTVEDAINARIASLAPAERALLEMASSMGGVFWLGALVALGRIDKPTPTLWGGAEDLSLQYRDLLDGLVQREYIIALPDSAIAGDAEFAFTHNLERERLYALASRTQMRRYHLTIAEWLEFHLADRAEEQCELLAHHYERGGVTRKAGVNYLLAGDRARGRYANAKAIEFYTKGLELIGEEDVLLRVDGLHHLGDVLQLAGRNDEALAAFKQMLAIAFRLDLKAKGGAAHNRIGRVYRAISRLEEAMRHLGTGHALFDAAGDQRGVASSLDDVGKVHWFRGHYDTAERFVKRALELRQELGDPRSIALSYNNLGLVYYDSGRFSEALEALEHALELRRTINDWHGMAQTLNNIGTIHQDRQEYSVAIGLWTEALQYASGVGDRMREAIILTNIGEAQYRMNNPAEAIRVLKQAEEISETLGDRLLEGEIFRGLAKAHMLANDLSAARDHIQRCIELFEQAKAKPFLGTAWRTYAEILAAGSWGGGGEEHSKAQEAFARAIAIFEDLGNDLEIARSCDAYAAFLSSIDDDASRSKAQAYSARAAEIRERLHNSEADLAPPIEVDFGALERP